MTAFSADQPWRRPRREPRRQPSWKTSCSDRAATKPWRRSGENSVRRYQYGRLSPGFAAVATRKVANEGLAGPGMEADLLAHRATSALRGDPDVVAAQSFERELHVVGSDRLAAAERQHRGAPEHLGLEVTDPAAEAQQTGQEFVDRHVTVARTFLAVPVDRQDKMIHAARAADFVPKTHRDAGTEHGDQDFRFSAVMDVALHQ